MTAVLAERRPLFGWTHAVRVTTPIAAGLTVAGLAFWCALFAVVLSPIQEHRSQANLYAALRGRLAAETVPTRGTIRHGAPIALLDIPAINLRHVVIVEGTTPGDLENGPGHRRDTPLPGQRGVSVLMGRSALFGAPFRHVGSLQAGDGITVATGEGVYRYRVDRLRRAGDPEHALPARGGRLTLITSEASGRGLEASRRTLYVDATLLGRAGVASPGRPISVPASEATMEGDSRVLMPLALWLLALVGTVGAAVWASARWGHDQLLLVAMPVVLALLWLVTETAVQLLPNVV